MALQVNITVDRTVHLTLADGSEIARYDRAGKWYREWPDGGRVWMRLAEAVSWAHEKDSVWHHGRPGGGAFDRAVSKFRAVS